MHRTFAAALTVAVGASLGLVAPPATSTHVIHATVAKPATPDPCGHAPTTSPRVKHVVWVWMENHSTQQVIGKPGSTAAKRAPYLNALARSCALAAGYHAITHPSLPNYLAATSGSTHGVARTCLPADCSVKGASIFSQVSSTGRHWRSYSEAMPHRCYRKNAGKYVPRHNPAVYYRALRTPCATYDVALGSRTSGRFTRDARTGHLPAFAYVQPDQCHNTHDCSIRTGDTWLRSRLAPVLATADYRAGRTVVFLVWDEGEGGHVGQHCRRSTARSCRMPLLALAAGIPSGTRVTRTVDHYALLHTTESLLGITNHLGHAGTAPDLRRHLGL